MAASNRMRNVVNRCVALLSSLLTGPVGPIPTPAQLHNTMMRRLSGVAIVLLGAEVVHRAGHTDQQWQYVAMAAALVPQALVSALALRDRDRRARLRTSTRPALLLLLTALVLAVASAATLLLGSAVAPATAALCAAAGLAVAAAPVTVRFASPR